MLSIQKFGCILIAALICSAAFAQNIIVSGNITDASTGEPVPYATVQVKGTTKGVSSDNEGHYSISVQHDMIRHSPAVSRTGPRQHRPQWHGAIC